MMVEDVGVEAKEAAVREVAKLLPLTELLAIYFFNQGRLHRTSTGFVAAEKKRVEEPASDIGLEPLCAMINNNLRCYDLAMELSNSTLEALPQNYAEQVVQECKEIYENTLVLVDGNPPKTGFVFPRLKCLASSKGSLWRKLT